MENKKYKLKRRYQGGYLWMIPILALIISISALWIWETRKGEPERLYTAAVADAVTADPEEIEPLVELTKDSPMTTWDEKGRVLLLSWHRHPERYIEGKESKLTNGSVWTFTDKEIVAWYEANGSNITDWDLRLEQLIGLPPDAGYTHVSAFWAKPEDVIRPAYVTDSTKQMSLSFPKGTDPDFLEWFEENRIFSYEESAYPWTRLGYTYDWADNGTEYGLTEFLIQENAEVEIVFTKTTTEFIQWLTQGKDGK